MNSVNISGWTAKHARVKRALIKSIAEAVDLATDNLFKATAKNLTGPHYPIGTRGPMTGQMPIPRITSVLSQSLKRRKLDWRLSAVYSDERVANYNKYVHDGTKGRRPRRFLGDAVVAQRPVGQNIMRYHIISALRKAGQ